MKHNSLSYLNTAIILAGGKSIRMGKDKALIEINGVTTINRIAEKILKTGLNIMIIANKNNYSKLSYPVFSDLISEKGPIGGIYTGLKVCTSQQALFLAVDMFLINENILNIIIGHSIFNECVIPLVNNHYEPLCAVYSKKYLDLFYTKIQNNQLSLQSLIPELNAFHPEMSTFSKYFRSMNTQEDFNEMKKKL